MIAGRYTRVRPVGRGGTGSVWLGRDEVLGRDVALKRLGLLPGSDTTDLARVEREATLSARLQHPHVVAVHDVVVDETTDAHWLVMELVDGPTLAQVVRDHGALGPEHAARVTAQVADALAAAHAAGITHRDVKPSNVLLDRGGQAKLTDFGIARLTSDPALTQTGLVTGSPAYLAPEVAAGGRGEESVDVWSLGALLYCLLTGRSPYDGGEDLGSTMGTLYRIVHEDPPRLPDAGPLAVVLEGTLVKDPARRWPMARVRDVLADVAAGVAPTVATPGPTPGPTAAVDPAPTSSRRRRPVRLLLVLLAVALVSAAGYLGLRTAPTDQTAAPPAASPTPSPTPSPSPTPTPSPTPSPSPSPTPAEPTEEGMTAFVQQYVEAVAADPATSWQLLTPKFQRESGGFEQYAAFWDSATNPSVSEISTDPQTLVVSYQVRYDDFDNGPGPTVLQLVHDEESDTYRIDGETTEGFVPAR